MRTLIVEDHFLEAPDVVRKEALSAGFKTAIFRDVAYHGISPVIPEINLGRLALILGFAPRVTLSFYRLNLASDIPTTYIHPDSAESEWAGVVHLTASEHCRGGTAFWKHRKTGACSFYSAHPPGEASLYREDGLDETKWDLVSLIGMQHNRLLIYPSRLFHSRYPKRTWGDTPETGRLILAFFFNRA